jgi:hypothetical protein
MRRALAITTVLFAVLCIVARLRYAPPAPAPRDTAPDRFSAERARDVQRTLSENEATRTLGSIGNEHGRKAIAEALERAGFAVERQKAVSCTYHGFCAHVENIIAVLEGSRANAPGILVAAHHDSVPVSHGASDDGAGAAAIVETARALAAGPKLRHLLIVLLTDGEEAGLLGAEAFAKESAWAKRVRAVINVDSRGSAGPSQMFETSKDNAWLIAAMAEHVPRPSTTSLFYEVYKRMPNDTDFTVLKALGSGVNFANIARIEHYHTPLDSFANADPGTLQHHGDNALGMARALDSADLEKAPPSGDATWFDVMAFGIVRWPERMTLPLALVALVLALLAAHRLRAWGLGVAGGVTALVAATVAALVVGLLLKLFGALPAPWIAHPIASSIALHFASGAAGSAIGLLFRSENPRSLFAGVWLIWAVIGVGAASVAPGTAFLFVVPALVALLVALVSFEAACIAGAVAAALVLFPLALALYDALGFMAPAMTALPSILLVTTVLPMIGGLNRRAPLALAGASIIAVIAAAIVPKFSADVPQRTNVVFRQEESGDAKVFVDTAWGPTSWGAPPASMVRALEAGSRVGHEAPFSWSIPALYAPAPRIEAPLPEVNVRGTQVEGGHRKVTLVARSLRRAPNLALVLPQGRAMTVRVEGKTAIPRWGYVVGMKAVPDQGMEIAIDATGPEPIAGWLLDQTDGVPDGTIARAAVMARPRDAVPTQDGDVTVLVRALTF